MSREYRWRRWLARPRHHCYGARLRATGLMRASLSSRRQMALHTARNSHWHSVLVVGDVIQARDMTAPSIMSGWSAVMAFVVAGIDIVTIWRRCHYEITYDCLVVI